MFNLKQFSLSVAAIAATVTLSAAFSTTAQAATLFTTDFIPDATRTNFNGFEGLPENFGGSVYVEDGIKVEQVNGSNNIGTLNYPGFEGERSWYPSGGDFGYIKITRANGSDFLNVGLLRNSGFSSSLTTSVYQLLKNGVSVLTGNLIGINPDSSYSYLGFSGGGFDEVRLGNYFGNDPNQTLSGYNALAIDSIELSGSAVQPVPTPALLPGLIGFGLGVLRKRKAQAVLEEQTA